MSGPVPLRYGGYYHVYNRGNNRENIFIEEHNYGYFLGLYAKCIEPVACTYAYSLLRNHFHLLVRIKALEELAGDLTGLANLSGLPDLSARRPSQQFSNLFNAYTKAINRAYGRVGSLFQRPFGRVEVTSDGYFAQLVVYVHQNPQRHGLVGDFRVWPHSSYRAHLSARPTRLKREDVLAWFDGPAGFMAAHAQEVGAPALAPLVGDDLE